MNETPLSEKAIIIHSEDNVAIAKTAIGLGTVLRLNGTRLAVTQTVQPGHKIALRSISKGQAVIRYGQVIGVATEDIPQGGTVHVHNMTIDTLRRQYENCAAYKPVECLRDRKSTRLNSSHVKISYAVFCLKKKT